MGSLSVRLQEAICCRCRSYSYHNTQKRPFSKKCKKKKSVWDASEDASESLKLKTARQITCKLLPTQSCNTDRQGRIELRVFTSVRFGAATLTLLFLAEISLL